MSLKMINRKSMFAGTFALFLGVMAVCSSVHTVAHPFAPAAGDTTARKAKLNEKLLKAWNSFATAAKTGNMKTLKALSAGCVYCGYCLYNTDAENKTYVEGMKTDPDKWMAKVNGELQYIPIDRFLKEDATEIFTKALLDKMADPKDLYMQHCEINPKVFVKLCFSKRPISSNPVFTDVVVTDHSVKHGLNRVFTFMETAEGYKFCGFSIAP